MPSAIFLMGPTASGKTTAAITLAQHLPVEVISVDSALVFRDMNIGTAKPDAEVLQAVPHHLIDIIDPLHSYSVAQFIEDARALMAEITLRGKIPLLVGGTMLYFNGLQYGLHALPQADAALRAKLDQQAQELGWPAMHRQLAQLDPETAARLDVTDTQRIQRALEVCLLSHQPMSWLLKETRSAPLAYDLLKIALVPSHRHLLHARIEQRLNHMMKLGFIDEVRSLQIRYPTLQPHFPSMRCVGYRQAWQYLADAYDLATFQEKACAATRQLAKRQLTWLRKMPDCIEINCLDPQYVLQIQQHIDVFLAMHAVGI